MQKKRLRMVNGDYELAGSPENAINYTTYGSINNPNELKVQVQVSWLDKISIVGSTEDLVLLDIVLTILLL